MPDGSFDEQVEDDEVLHRSVWLKPMCFQIDEDGNVWASPEAFADKSKKASLFRHKLCESPPESNPPRMSETDAVADLIAGTIRETAPIVHKSEGQVAVTHYVIVEPDVSDGQHPAHAIVFANPAFQTRGAYEKLKIRLAQLAGKWSIPPPQKFVEELNQ